MKQRTRYENDTKKTKKKFLLSLLFVLAMIWHRLACTTLCNAMFSILTSQFCVADVFVSGLFWFLFWRFQLLRLVSYSTTFFIFSFLVFFLIFISYNSGYRITVNDLGWTTNHSWQFFKRRWRSTISIPLPSGILTIPFLFISLNLLYSDLQPFFPPQLQPGVNDTLSSKNRKKQEKKPVPSHYFPYFSISTSNNPILFLFSFARHRHIIMPHFFQFWSF